MNVIEEMAVYGTSEQKRAAAGFVRGPRVTVFERIHRELCDPSSAISRELALAEARRDQAYSAYLDGR